MTRIISKLSIIILLAYFVVAINGECCAKRMGNSINNIDWSSYVSNVKNQENTPLCWAYATVSYLEIMYSYMSEIYVRFSPIQVGRNTYREKLARNNNCYDPIDKERSGTSVCGLQYVQRRGIMTEDDYEKNGYDTALITTIGINKINYEYDSNYNRFSTQLNKTPVIIYIIGTDLEYLENKILMNAPITHAVVATNICQQQNATYVEYLNSYGEQWGECGGFGYIKITDDSNKIINNRLVFSALITAELSDIRLSMNDSCSATQNTMYVIMFMTFFSILLLIGFNIAIYIKFMNNKKNHNDATNNI